MNIQCTVEEFKELLEGKESKTPLEIMKQAFKDAVITEKTDCTGRTEILIKETNLSDCINKNKSN